MDNHLYNLFSQLVQDRRSIYRINKFYFKDAKNCKKCKEFWRKLVAEKEKIATEVLELIKNHNI